VLMTTDAPVMAALRALRELGVRVAIDDFGTGYSSFSYILQYQFDRLKIDRSFISRATTDLGAAAIIHTVIAMAHALNLTVVAEGVETLDQMNFLHGENCDQIQGFLFSKAVPLSEFTNALNRIVQEAKGRMTPAGARPKRGLAGGRGLPSERINRVDRHLPSKSGVRRIHPSERGTQPPSVHV
jgi:predicted signal transduction protein with EAL and GGDEF domain